MTTLVAMAAPAIDRLAAWVAAQPGDYDPSSGHGPEWGKAAPAGLLIWLFLGVALFFLVKSMNRHLRRVSKKFDDAAAGSDTGIPPDMTTLTASSSDAGSGSDAAGGSGDCAGDDARDKAGAADKVAVDD